MTDIKPYWQNYIDGSWVDGGAGRIDVINPGMGAKLAEHALADAADVDHAVQASRRVHLSGALGGLRPVERGRMVQTMGRYLLDNIEDIAHVLTSEQGKPLWESFGFRRKFFESLSEPSPSDTVIQRGPRIAGRVRDRFD